MHLLSIDIRIHSLLSYVPLCIDCLYRWSVILFSQKSAHRHPTLNHR